MGEQFIGLVVGHERGVVREVQLADQVKRVLAEVPLGCSNADRTRSAESLDDVDAAHEQVTLGVTVKCRVPFVDPAVECDLVSGGCARCDLLRMEERRHRWDEEGNGNPVPIEESEDARDGDPGAVFALRELAGVRFPAAQRNRLVIRIERERNRDGRPVRPSRRFEGSPGADTADVAAPPGLLPRPGFVAGYHFTTAWIHVAQRYEVWCGRSVAVTRGYASEAVTVRLPSAPVLAACQTTMAIFTPRRISGHTSTAMIAESMPPMVPTWSKK